LDLTLRKPILNTQTNVINTQRAVTGVQPKLSLEINKEEHNHLKSYEKTKKPKVQTKTPKSKD
jgi:hypothetical protein